jgi:hypothetical protein
VQEVLADGQPRTRTQIAIALLDRLTPEDAAHADPARHNEAAWATKPMFNRVQSGARALAFDALTYLVRLGRVLREEDEAGHTTYRLAPRVETEEDRAWRSAYERARAREGGASCS